MYFWSYNLRKTWLDKSSILEDPSTSNIVNGPKHCSKLNDSIITILIHPCEWNSVWKSLSEWYARSQDSLLTNCLLVTSIFVLIETICSNIFRCKYLKNKNYFLNFFFSFSKFSFNFDHFKKRADPRIWAFVNLRTPKDVVR